jgi:TRAP-type transport system periplasmic protein
MIQTTKALLMMAFAAGMTLPASAQERTLKALGQPAATGMIQKNKEAIFFENFAERTGLDIDVSFQPLDQTGIKDAEELRILKSGLFDIISLRLQQVSRDAPVLFGLDLVGQNPDYESARQSVEEFGPYVDEQLQEQFGVKMLGYWPFGPQVMFCDAPIEGLSDIQGLKVRTDDQNLANFIQSLGGIPVTMGFADVHQSLARGVVDCGITGPSSANSSSWPEETTHVLPLGFKSAIQGYGMNLNVWNSFSEEEQQKIQAAFDELSDEIFAYSQELFDDAMRCNAGETPCELNKPYDLTTVEVSDADREKIREAVKQVSFPAFAELCNQNIEGCGDAWTERVGTRLGM